MASEQQMKDFDNARSVLETAARIKNPEVKSLFDLPDRKGILLKLINLAAYQQQQIEALHRALMVVANNDRMIYDNPEFQRALSLRPPEGEFNDIEDEPDDTGKEESFPLDEDVDQDDHSSTSRIR